MNPEMMKNASNMLAGMSDSQIQMYLAQMGMTGVDPSMFRSLCQNMSNMSDSQFNSMKNMAQANIQNMSNNSNNNYSNNNNDKYNGTIVQEVTKIKEDGNNLFRSNKFEDAIKKYYEAIEEIKTTIDKDKYKNELDDIERTCRLNIANCKLKTKDYDGVINECSIVLENKKCFKGYYRMGLALMNKNKYDKAYRYLDNANAIGTTAEKQAVEPHLKECKEKLDEIKKKKEKKDLRKKMKKNKKKRKRKKKIIIQ
jgi:tetratricopeptide (TPR) repeat protein